MVTVWRVLIFALPLMTGCAFLQKTDFRTIVHPVVEEIKRDIDYYRSDELETADALEATHEDGSPMTTLDVLGPGSFSRWLEDIGDREKDYGFPKGGIICPDTVCTELIPDEAKRFTLYLLEREKFLEWYALREKLRKKETVRTEVKLSPATVIGVTKMWSWNSDGDLADGIRMSYEFGGWIELYSDSFIRIDFGGYLNREYEPSGAMTVRSIDIPEEVPLLDGKFAETSKKSESIELDLFLSGTVEVMSWTLNPINPNWLQVKFQLRAGPGIVVDSAVTFTEYGIRVLSTDGEFERATIPNKMKTAGYFSGFFYGVLDLPFFVRMEVAAIVNKKESRFDYAIGARVPF